MQLGKAKLDNVQVLNESKKILRFKNIIDSHSDENNQDYFDYIPKWYSIHPKGTYNKYLQVIFEISQILGLIYFPLELVYYKPYINHIIHPNENYHVKYFVLHSTLQAIFNIWFISSFFTAVLHNTNKKLAFSFGLIVKIMF